VHATTLPVAEHYAAQQTLRFVLDHVGADSCRILEVGAGQGALALLLQHAGHDVLALDSDAAAVAVARGRGVPAHCASWPDFAAAQFDLIIFSRSLHHMGRLPEALARAHAALVPHGRVLVEDFAFHEVDRTSIAWFRALLEQLRGQNRLLDVATSFASQILNAPDPAAVWWREADHIHPAARLHEAMSACFRIERSERVPYFYRYIAPHLVDPSADALDALIAEERRAADSGRITLIGRRYAAARGAV
jgi:SAM-dependent methyltransferase